MITDAAMRDQVTEALGLDAIDFDIPMIVEDIQQAHGAVHLDDVPHDWFWVIVEKHSIV